MSEADIHSISSMNPKEPLLSQLPSSLNKQISDIISSISDIHQSSLILLTFHDSHHFAFDLSVSDDDLSSCSETLDQVLTSDNPIYIDNLECQLMLNGGPVSHYFGIALRSAENEAIGVLSLLGVQAYEFSSQEEQLMVVFAECIADKLALYKKDRELKELEEFSSLITDTNQDYIFVKDSQYRLVRANPSFMALHPESIRQYLFSADWAKAYTEEDAETFLKYDKMTLKEGRTEVKEKLTLPNGESLLLHTTKNRFEDSKGNQYILGVSRDISEREQLLADLRKSNQDLDEFAYVASHDLKAPLNAIDRLVTWIEEDATEQFDEDTKKHFSMIKSRVKRMNTLLSDLLSYSRIGREEHEPVCLNLKLSVASCFELLDIPKGFSFEIDDADVVLPRVPMELILTNLISNAIKHHDCDNGLIKVSYVKTETQHQVAVTDDGPGINAKMHEKVFERFQTLKPRDQVEGSGLGLAMVQKMAQHLGGDISLESALGEGSKFTFAWPI